MYLELQAGLKDALGDTGESTEDLTGANELLEDQIRKTDDAYSDLKGELNAEEDFLAAEGMWADLAQSAVDSYTAAADGSEDAAAKADAHRQKVVDTKLEVLDLGEKYRELPPEQVTKVIALIDEGKLAEAELLFSQLTRDRPLYINLQTRGGGGILAGINPNTGKPWGVGATGGIVTQPTFALIGEAGPEAVVPLNQMPGASPLPNGHGGGTPINITVNAGMGADGRRIGDAVVDAIRDFERRNGTAWRR